jgi:hypothetical protein
MGGSIMVFLYVESLIFCSLFLLLTNPYIKGFLSNLYLRPSCHHCPSKGGRSGADLTIADFWGIESVMPDFDDDKGTGLLIVHSKKGKEILPMLNLDSHEVSLEKAIVGNSAYIQSVEAHPKRETFFALFHKTLCLLPKW